MSTRQKHGQLCQILVTSRFEAYLFVSITLLQIFAIATLWEQTPLQVLLLFFKKEKTIDPTPRNETWLIVRVNYGKLKTRWMQCNNLNYKTKCLYQGNWFILKCQTLWSISNQKEILMKGGFNVLTWDNWKIRNSYFLYIQHKKSTTFVCTKNTNSSPILAMTSTIQFFFKPLK